MPYWRLYYHITWGTKHRAPLITPQIEVRLHKAIAAKAIKMGAIVHAIGGIEDHVHLVASVPPKLSLSNFIGDVKGNSSHFVNHVLVPDFYFSWQSEYGVQSFGEKQLLFIVRYAQQQKEHHAQMSMIQQLECVE